MLKTQICQCPLNGISKQVKNVKHTKQNVEAFAGYKGVEGSTNYRKEMGVR